MATRTNADGDALRRLREEAWLNQKELADLAGVAQHTVMRIETGQSPHPHRPTLRALANALGVSPNELVKDRPNPLGRSSILAGASAA